MDWNVRPLAELHSERGSGKLWVPAPGIIVTRATGYGDLALIHLYTERAEREFSATRRLRIFHHWRAIDGFDPNARAYLRRWAAAHAEHLADAHYLVGSRLLAMAISAAALALGRDLRSYTEETKFLLALAQAVREAKAAGPTR